MNDRSEGYMMKKAVNRLIVFVFLCIPLTACQSGDDQFKIIVFSDDIYEQKEKIESKLDLGTDTEITFYPEIAERLLTELASHQSSLLIVEQRLAKQMVEYEAMIHLEGFDIGFADEEYLQGEEGAQEIKALNLNESSLLQEERDVLLENNHIVGIPVYSPQPEEAIEILETLFPN